MELLLNLVWLLLALPAFLVWRGRTASRTSGSLQSLLTLACLLTILFPVISASDDLRVMRSEVEESSVTKRTLRHASPDRYSASGLHSPVAVVSVASDFFVAEVTWRSQLNPEPLSLCFFDNKTASRAPPSLVLS